MTNKNDKTLAPIKQRIIQVIDNEVDNKAKFFIENGFSSSNFRGPALYSEVSGEVIAKILTIFPKVDAEWLITGNLKEKVQIEPGLSHDFIDDSIGVRIKNLRTSRDLKQKDIALLLDMDPSQYSKIESCKLMPTLSQIIQLSKILNESIDYIISGSKIENESSMYKEINSALKDQIELLKENKKFLENEINTLKSNRTENKTYNPYVSESKPKLEK